MQVCFGDRAGSARHQLGKCDEAAALQVNANSKVYDERWSMHSGSSVIIVHFIHYEAIESV